MILPDDDVKLIDFGLAKEKDSGKSKMTTMAGTPYYMAPEVIEGTYTSQCDIWSLGVVLYTMLCGHLPFLGDNRPEVFEKIKAGDFNFDGKAWAKVSNEAQDLVNRMLTVNHKKRYDATSCLKHKWFKVLHQDDDHHEHLD